MGASLSTDTAIIILATIAAVYFVITAVCLTCVCWCVCSKKKCKARVKPIRDVYSSPRHENVYNDGVYTDTTSFTSSSGTSVTTDVSSNVSGGLVVKNRSVLGRSNKKSKDPLTDSEWQGGRDSAILEGFGQVVSSSEGTASSSGSINDAEKFDLSTTTDAQTHTEDSKKDLSILSQGQTLDSTGQNDVSHTSTTEDDDDNVFEDSTVGKVNEGEQNKTQARSTVTFEERKQKKIAQKKKKKQVVFRTDSTKPLLNGSESRTQSETSDIGQSDIPSYIEPRPLTPMQEDQPPQPPSLTPIKITPRHTLTPITTTPNKGNSPLRGTPVNQNLASSIVRERPVLPKIGQSITPIKVELAPRAAKPKAIDDDEEENTLSML